VTDRRHWLLEGLDRNEVLNASICKFARLVRHTEAPFTGQKFVPEPWQDAYFYRLFETKRPDGLRQYERSFLALPRKNGKTAMCAVIGGHEGFCGPRGGQILIAAGDKQQASLLFQACTRFIRSCPALEKRAKIYRNSIVIPSRETSIMFLSAEHKTKHGLNPSLVIIDEYHVQKNRDLANVLETGMGAREEPMVIYITTAGMDRIGPCYDEWQRALKVQNGILEDPTLLPMIFAADPDADPFSEETWKAANPNYGVTVQKKFLESKAVLARESVHEEITFRTLYLNQWCSNGESKFFRIGQFEACSEPIRPADGRPCYIGLDLSSTQDTIGFAAVWPGLDDDGVPDGTYDAFAHIFIPEKNIDRAEAPYRQWQKDGFCTITEGDIADYDVVRDYVIDFCERHFVRMVAIDRWNATHVITQLTNEGITVKPFGQGFASMSGPTKLLESLVISQRLRHGGCPPLVYHAENLQVKQDDAGNMKPTKKNASPHNRNDSAVALIMALGAASGEAPPPDDDPIPVVLG
jgi:phage terminase large subunit-like protein